MKKRLLFIALSGFVTFTSLAQSTVITPGSTQINTLSSFPLGINVKSGQTAFFDFSRGGVLSAGINNTASPIQLKIGIASDNRGVDAYNDIVIDSTTRNIGFGTNNPQVKYHFYSTEGNGKILLESYGDYPFLMLKGNNNGNKGIGWYNSSGGIIGFLYYNGSSNKMHWGFGNSSKEITIDGNTKNVGIGTENPTNANLHVFGKKESGGINLKIEADAAGSEGYPGLTLVKNNYGGSIFGRTDGAGGINVGDLIGLNFGPVHASAFNISSDINVKKEVVNLDNGDFEAYLNQIRNIQSATYRYKWEESETRKNSHIGFIAQTLPKEVITEMDTSPDGSSGEVNLGYNLSDMIGLNVLGIKAVDAKIQRMEDIIKLQQEQISLLMAEVEKMKNK